jgi:ribosomal protein S18 acetylase RimI-like enzyme
MTRLGARFLRSYYGLVLTTPAGIGLVAEARAQVVGFIAGYMNPKDFHQVLRASKVRLATSMLPALLRDPRLLGRALASFRRTDPEQIDKRVGLSELASVAVDPTHGGQGLGARLVRSFVDEVRVRGPRGVYLTTDAEGNDAVNRLYVKLGFTLALTFRAGEGRMMNEYRIDFEGGPKG